MENNLKDTVMVRSESDWTIVVDYPPLMFSRAWRQRGTTFPIPRKDLFQMYYEPGIAALFEEGSLVTDDEEFMKSVGLMTDSGEKEVTPLTEQMMIRLIKNMPLAELEPALKKLNGIQRRDLGDYAIRNYKIMPLDRIDLFSKYCGRDLLKAVENYKLAQEA